MQGLQTRGTVTVTEINYRVVAGPPVPVKTLKEILIRKILYTGSTVRAFFCILGFRSWLSSSYRIPPLRYASPHPCCSDPPPTPFFPPPPHADPADEDILRSPADAFVRSRSIVFYRHPCVVPPAHRCVARSPTSYYPRRTTRTSRVPESARSWITYVDRTFARDVGVVHPCARPDVMRCVVHERWDRSCADARCARHSALPDAPSSSRPDHEVRTHSGDRAYGDRARSYDVLTVAVAVCADVAVDG